MREQRPEDAIAGRRSTPGFSGVFPWVSKWREVMFGALVLGLVWLLTHPVIPKAAAGTLQTGQHEATSATAADIVGHVAPTGTPLPALTSSPKPRLVASDLGGTPPPSRPLPVALVTPYAPPQPPPAPPPAIPPTLSPAAIAEAQRAQEDRAAQDAPLDVSSPPAPAQGADESPRQREGADVAPPPGTFLAPHTEIDVTLYTSIDSTIPGGITGFIGRDVLDFFKREVLIPANSKIVGHLATTTIQPGQNRVGAIWEGVILPNGHEIVLANEPGIDLTGTTGFGAAIDNHTRKAITNVIAFSLLAVGAQLLQPTSNCSSGQTCVNVGQSLGSAIVNAGASQFNHSQNIPPTAHVVEGAQVGVMITNYLALEPWRG